MAGDLAKRGKAQHIVVTMGVAPVPGGASRDSGGSTILGVWIWLVWFVWSLLWYFGPQVLSPCVTAPGMAGSVGRKLKLASPQSRAAPTLTATLILQVMWCCC